MKTVDSVAGSIGKRGVVVIAASFRKAYGFEEGAHFVQEATPEGVLIRPAATVPVRLYSDKDKATFMLNNAGSREEYQAALTAVKQMGLDPKKVKHQAWK
jgi:bifunctional DNA-binding transcriptional regulator/antitoxin component of YhaV-PrlF toxin-antitoxin module